MMNWAQEMRIDRGILRGPKPDRSQLNMFKGAPTININQLRGQHIVGNVPFSNINQSAELLARDSRHI